MRRNFILILLIIGADLYSQQIDINEYISITKAVLSNEEIRDNLVKYSRFNIHPMYDSNSVFVVDPIHIDKEIIINDYNPKFRITDFFDIESGSVNYWLFPTDILISKNKIKYSFKTQSRFWQDSTEYIQGVLYLKKINNNWLIQKADISPYEFKEAMEIECYDMPIECSTDFNRPKKSGTNNPFFGDWQCLCDSVYWEIFHSDDTLYTYWEMGHALHDTQYEVTETDYIIYTSDSNQVKLHYEIIDKDKIRIYSNYQDTWQGDTTIVSEDYVLNRIRGAGYKYSDVRCWGKMSEKYDCFIESYDAFKYYEAFHKRMWKYKTDKWYKE